MTRTSRAAIFVLGLVALLVAVGGVLALLGQRDGGRTATKRPGGAAAIFVATDGDDSGSGSESEPLRTLGAAVEKARPGDVVHVGGGTYDERVEFSSSGTAEDPVTFEASGNEAVTISRGFRVTGDHLVIRGFTVYPGESDASVFEAERSEDSYYTHTTGQIQITGSHNLLERISHHDEDDVTPQGVSSLAFLHGTDNTVRDIDFRECDPVYFAGNDREPPGSGRRNRISGGTIHHTDRAFIMIEADDAVVEGLDLHDSGQTDRDSGDSDAADGIGLNGSRIAIRDCRIYRVFAQTPDQHTDAIQWWNQADDLVIEGNSIGSAERGGTLGRNDQGHIQWTSETPGKTSRRVTIRNNIFLGTDVPYVINGSPEQTIPGQADDWRIVGNTFVCPQSVRPDLLQSCSGWVIADNVFHSSGAFPDTREGTRISHNCYVRCDPPPQESSSFRAEDPRFAAGDLSSASSFGVKADWRPLKGSPLAGKGVRLEELEADMAGSARPDPPSVGAFEPVAE